MASGVGTEVAATPVQSPPCFQDVRTCYTCLQDACSAVAINPTWAKTYWRKGVALRGLKRFPEAVQAFYQASIILKGKHEGERCLHPASFWA